MAEQASDKAQAPVTEDGSIVAASEALLSMLEADDAPPTEESAEPTEDEVVDAQPETEADSDEEVEESTEESDDEDDDEYEPDENRDTEGDEVTETYVVKVDGVDTEVTKEELLSGYSRHSDYTKKTQQLSEERKQMIEIAKAYQHEVQQTQQMRQQYVQQIGQYVQQGLQGLQQYGQINWSQLKEEDPLEYVTKRDEFREQQHQVKSMQEQQQHAIRVQHHEAQTAYAEQLEREQGKLMEALPDWADEKKRPELAGKIREYAQSVGFSSDEVDSVVDHRAVQVLLKAAKYDELQNSDPKMKKVKRNPRIVSAGSRKEKGQTNAKKRKAQMNRLKSSGDTKDAARLLEDII